jgi:hypothetical protein
MRDYLLDIIKNTHGLGKITMVKITGTDQETRINALAEERLFVVMAKFHNPIADFMGRFGMPGLSRLNAIVNAEEYREGAVLSVARHGDEPESINFRNKTGDFTNNYRFMSSGVVDKLIPDVMFKGTKWALQFEPSVLSIQRMRSQASINSDESTFVVRTNDKTGLVFKFGDPASLSGEFVFQDSVSAALSGERHYPVQAVLNILSLGGDKVMKISNDGIMSITVDSGLGLYDFIVPSLQK